MLIVPQKVNVKWYPKKKKYYELKGYIFTKMDDYFECDIEDLTKGSDVQVKIQCDYCGKIFSRSYNDYNSKRRKSIIEKDCCCDCIQIKAEESLLLKYGVSNPNKLSKTVENRKNTNLIKYGYINPMQSEVVHENFKRTMLERYGVEYYSQTEEWVNKTIKTSLEKFGTKNSSQNLLVRQKQLDTLYKNGTAPCSSQQKHIHNLVDGELNFPVKNTSLDIAFPDEMIYIEYDGGGHELQVKFGNKTQEQFNKEQRKRWYTLYRKGWCEIRIVSKSDKLPTDNIILQMIDFAKQYLSTNHSWITFDIDNGIVKSSQFKREYDFGKLRRIKKERIKVS